MKIATRRHEIAPNSQSDAAPIINSIERRRCIVAGAAGMAAIGARLQK